MEPHKAQKNTMDLVGRIPVKHFSLPNSWLDEAG